MPRAIKMSGEKNFAEKLIVTDITNPLPFKGLIFKSNFMDTKNGLALLMPFCASIFFLQYLFLSLQ
jgi:hypothetical protein